MFEVQEHGKMFRISINILFSNHIKRNSITKLRVIDPINIEEYIANGGYKSYLNMIKENAPVDICNSVEASGLRGRGGGGFQPEENGNLL
jgi:NADH:ubiquinone oxidoreductase subunit F (NADH-binding)